MERSDGRVAHARTCKTQNKYASETSLLKKYINSMTELNTLVCGMHELHLYEISGWDSGYSVRILRTG